MNMMIYLRKLPILLLFLGASLSASSTTLLIDTRDSLPRSEMEIDEKTRVVSLESGLMDVLFEEGHIFFNMFTPVRDYSPGEMSREDEKALADAGEFGAAFLLVLRPDEKGAYWKLCRVGAPGNPVEGFADYSETDPDKSIRERWISLGNILAYSVIPLIR